MRKYVLAAAAAAAFATPAAARDNSPYVGIEGGVLFPQKQQLDGSIDFASPSIADVGEASVGRVKSKVGFDLDIIGGYDFGLFRLEGELGYKQAKIKRLDLDPAFVAALNNAAGTSLTGGSFDLGDKTKVYSAMVNGLVQHELVNGIIGFVGGGVGYASVHEFGDKKGKFAWQLLAGVRKPITSHIDVGLKYRYFRTGKLDVGDDFAFTPGTGACGAAACTGGTAFLNSRDRFESHSVLASLTYNFGATEAPPPPLPPAASLAPEPVAPATRACPDGAVVLATSACPASPPPAPSPAERGERGH